MSEMQKVTENDVAYLLSWHSEDRKERIYCSFSSTKSLPGTWGTRAKNYTRKFFEEFSVEILETQSGGVFIGKVIDEKEQIIKRKVYQTSATHIERVIGQITVHIAEYVNQGLQQDWTDDKWADIAKHARRVVDEMGAKSPMRQKTAERSPK